MFTTQRHLRFIIQTFQKLDVAERGGEDIQAQARLLNRKRKR